MEASVALPLLQFAVKLSGGHTKVYILLVHVGIRAVLQSGLGDEDKCYIWPLVFLLWQIPHATNLYTTHTAISGTNIKEWHISRFRVKPDKMQEVVRT